MLPGLLYHLGSLFLKCLQVRDLIDERLVFVVRVHAFVPLVLILHHIEGNPQVLSLSGRLPEVVGELVVVAGFVASALIFLEVVEVPIEVGLVQLAQGVAALVDYSSGSLKIEFSIDVGSVRSGSHLGQLSGCARGSEFCGVRVHFSLLIIIIFLMSVGLNTLERIKTQLKEAKNIGVSA